MKILKALLLCLIVVGVVSQFIPQSGDAPVQPVKGQLSEVMSTDFLEEINAARAKRGLPEFEGNARLYHFAEERACKLAETGQWSHDGYQDAFKAAGYNGSLIGENLARDFDNDQQVLAGWINSPPHAANIYHARFQEIGIGKCKGYVVLWLGRR